MASIGLGSIISLLGGIWGKRNDAQYWSGWISGDGPNRNVTVTAVTFEESGLDLSITDGTTKYELKAAPKDAEHTEVLLGVNGATPTLVTGAAMVFAPKPSLGDLTRFAFDFRPIKLADGKESRFNMRFDTHQGL